MAEKHFPKNSWNGLSKLWQPLLIIASIAFLIGLEIAIFGYFPGITDPTILQDSAMQLVFGAALLIILSYVAAIANQLLVLNKE